MTRRLVLSEPDRAYRSGTTKVRAEWLSTVTMLTGTSFIDDHLYRHLAAAADGLVGHNSKTTVITFAVNGKRSAVEERRTRERRVVERERSTCWATALGAASRALKSESDIDVILFI